jgi:hypothetical protein
MEYIKKATIVLILLGIFVGFTISIFLMVEHMEYGMAFALIIESAIASVVLIYLVERTRLHVLMQRRIIVVVVMMMICGTAFLEYMHFKAMYGFLKPIRKEFVGIPQEDRFIDPILKKRNKALEKKGYRMVGMWYKGNDGTQFHSFYFYTGGI